MRLARLLPLVLILVLAGCGSDDASGPTSATPTPESTPEATPEATRTTEAAPSDEPVRAQGDEPGIEVISTGLEVPWDIAFLPDERAFVTERPGRIRLVSASGEVRAAPVAEVEVEARGEGGLMGIDLDPEFDSGEPFAYVMRTDGGEVQVLRLRWSDGRLDPDATILDGIVAGSIHDSGRLRFGPDGRLYVVTGDSGQGELAQDRDSLNGKVLALDPQQYHGNEPAQPDIVSIGHRNPQGLDWRPRTDQLYVTEHGPSGFDGPSCCDELNRISQGGNYGWPRFGDDQPDSARPAYLWQETIAPSGMAFVTQPGSSWTGDLLVAALKGTALHRMAVARSEVRDADVLLDGRYGRLRAVVEAPDGALWVTTSNLDSYGERTSPEDDRIIRVVPPRA